MNIINEEARIEFEALVARGRKIITDIFEITRQSAANYPDGALNDLSDLTEDDLTNLAFAILAMSSFSPTSEFPAAAVRIFTILAAPEGVKDVMSGVADLGTVIKVPFSVIPGETFERALERFHESNPSVPVPPHVLQKLAQLFAHGQSEYEKHGVTAHAILDKWMAAATPLPHPDETYEQYMMRCGGYGHILNSMAETNPDFAQQHRLMMECVRDGMNAGIFSPDQLAPRPVESAPEYVISAVRESCPVGVQDIDIITHLVARTSLRAAKWIEDCSPVEFQQMIRTAFPDPIH